MKHLTKMVFLLLPFGLTGCLIGNGRICGPQTPTAYCHKNAYDALMNPVQLRDKWTKAGADVELRSVDWQACGGLPGGGISPDRRGATGLEAAELSKEKLYAAQRCMMSKGYHYTGTCEGSIPSRYPACEVRAE